MLQGRCKDACFARSCKWSPENTKKSSPLDRCLQGYCRIGGFEKIALGGPAPGQVIPAYLTSSNILAVPFQPRAFFSLGSRLQRLLPDGVYP